MAMGQNPNLTPFEPPNPKIGSKMVGEFTYPKRDPNTVLTTTANWTRSQSSLRPASGPAVGGCCLKAHPRRRASAGSPGSVGFGHLCGVGSTRKPEESQHCWGFPKQKGALRNIQRVGDHLRRALALAMEGTMQGNWKRLGRSWILVAPRDRYQAHTKSRVPL